MAKIIYDCAEASIGRLVDQFGPGKEGEIRIRYNVEGGRLERDPTIQGDIHRIAEEIVRESLF